MQIGKRRPQIGVALVGADCEGPLRGHGEIDARHGDVGREELAAQMFARLVRQVGGIAVAPRRAEFPFEEFAHLLAPHMDRRQHDMAGRTVHQLHDPLAQVALHGIDPLSGQEGREAALLGEHRLALDERPPAVPAQDVEHDPVHLAGVRKPSGRPFRWPSHCVRTLRDSVPDATACAA